MLRPAYETLYFLEPFVKVGLNLVFELSCVRLQLDPEVVNVGQRFLVQLNNFNVACLCSVFFILFFLALDRF